MFAYLFRRRPAFRYVWSPAIDFSHARVAAALRTFSLG